MTSLSESLIQADQLKSLGKYSEAIKLLSAAITESPDARLFFSRGHAKDMVYDFTGALEDYTKAIETDATQPEYYFNRGCMLSHSLNLNEEAIVDFESAINLDPDHLQSYRDCCLCLLQIGRPMRAWSYALKALKLSSSQDVSTQYCIGESQIALGWFDDAAVTFKEVVRLAPDTAHYWARLGHAIVHSTDANIAQAIDAYGNASLLSPDSALYIYAIGNLYQKLELDSVALSNYIRAKQICSADDEGLQILISNGIAAVEKRISCSS